MSTFRFQMEKMKDLGSFEFGMKSKLIMRKKKATGCSIDKTVFSHADARIYYWGDYPGGEVFFTFKETGGCSWSITEAVFDPADIGTPFIIYPPEPGYDYWEIGSYDGGVYFVMWWLVDPDGEVSVRMIWTVYSEVGIYFNVIVTWDDGEGNKVVQTYALALGVEIPA